MNPGCSLCRTCCAGSIAFTSCTTAMQSGSSGWSVAAACVKSKRVCRVWQRRAFLHLPCRDIRVWAILTRERSAAARSRACRTRVRRRWKRSVCVNRRTRSKRRKNASVWRVSNRRARRRSAGRQKKLRACNRKKKSGPAPPKRSVVEQKKNRRVLKLKRKRANARKRKKSGDRRKRPPRLRRWKKPACKLRPKRNEAQKKKLANRQKKKRVSRQRKKPDGLPKPKRWRDARLKRKPLVFVRKRKSVNVSPPKSAGKLKRLRV